MNVERRHHVQVAGSGPVTLFFAHGFGCDQTMWRLVQPAYARRFRTVTFDLVGAGQSDLSAYDPQKYSSLKAYADDVLELISQFGQGPVMFVGHSVSAMIGLLANLKAPGHIAAHVMIGPSPCYVNDGDYNGGFERADINALLSAMDNNYLVWAGTMAPVLMGAPDRPELGAELASSFCRTDPDIARQFARVAFLSDHRAQLPRLMTPTLILQCSDDLIAPVSVGHYMHQVLPHGTLKIIHNTGHYPHLTAPGAITEAIDAFLTSQGLETQNASPSTRASEAQDLLDQAPCGLVQTDAQGLLRQANLTFCQWLGYTPGELVGQRKLQDLLTTGCRIFHQTHSLPLLQLQGSVSEVRVQMLCKDGQRLPMLLNVRRHAQQGGMADEYALFVAQDRDKYEKELVRARTELEAMVAHANELQAQASDRAMLAEQMVGIVSHDLRNPIAAMLMGAELLGKCGVTPRQSDVLARIVRAGDRANRLIANLLDLTQVRLGSGLSVSPAAMELHAAVAGAVQELSQVFPDSVLRHVQQGPSRCIADADRLVQLVGNLVSNAMAYGEPGAPVVVTSARENAFFSLSVQNQGLPIPADIMDGLFELMVRGCDQVNSGRSVGLGLFIVSEIAKAHGGRVSVTSTPEGVTTFSVVIPQAPDL
ncbi:alpha/beta fold hydrolase [Polaromonas sp. CG_23.6]|uniref:alpha/beta fold hydrolase n=1 Tax=unclassified Polaromonas TaxID=2638319 RepID=UPI001A30D775|nr:PAS domain S-box-containing protein [Polaromonas sp. CG_9.7]MBG6113318.1 PAS domain S-box-containing protein [Polaromonas sp. CG_9.2]MDH6183227.1 PAS domain S-box-containing protein [Polaromonas sp. CG_23.6]